MSKKFVWALAIFLLALMSISYYQYYTLSVFQPENRCDADTDCLKPCEGVTRSCINNTCQLSGSCDKTIVQCLTANTCPPANCIGVLTTCENTKCTYKGSCDDVYLNLDCGDYPKAICLDGYFCDKNATDPPKCKRNIYYYTDCTEKDYTKSSQNNDKNNPLCGTEPYSINGTLIRDKEPAYCPTNYICEDTTTQLCSKIKNPCPSDFTCNWNTKTCENKISLDCNTLSCPKGYTCFEDLYGDGVCKYEIKKGIDCRQFGCLTDYNCTLSKLTATTTGYTCINTILQDGDDSDDSTNNIFWKTAFLIVSAFFSIFVIVIFSVLYFKKV